MINPNIDRDGVEWSPSAYSTINDRQMHPLEEAGYRIPDHWKITTLEPLVRKTCAVCKKLFVYQAINPRKVNYCSMKCRLMHQ